LLFEQKKYGEATEIISDVFKILIPNYSNREAFYPTQNPLCRNNFIGRLICRQLFLEQNQPKSLTSLCTFVSNRRFVCQLSRL
jgi:hypothetical protein